MANVVARAPGVLSDDVRSFLSAVPRYAAIATTNPDGTPHQNVIWYLLRYDEGSDVFVVNSRRGRRWPTNLERTHVASVAVHTGEDAVTVRCELIDVYGDERAYADINEMAARYDPPERASARIERFRNEERLSFVLRPRRVHTHGDPR